MLVVRVSKEARKGIEELSAESGRSMSALVDKAVRRLTVLHDRPHIEALTDVIVIFAQRIEDASINTTSIASDPETSRQFHDGMAKILEIYTAPPAEETDALRTAAMLKAEAALTLVQAGFDWSDPTFLTRGKK
jgi:hypothetical protein